MSSKKQKRLRAIDGGISVAEKKARKKFERQVAAHLLERAEAAEIEAFFQARRRRAVIGISLAIGAVLLIAGLAAVL